MVDTVTSYIVENDKDFRKALDRLGKVTSDFRIPFGSISRAWYRNNRKIFAFFPDLFQVFYLRNIIPIQYRELYTYGATVSKIIVEYLHHYKTIL